MTATSRSARRPRSLLSTALSLALMATMLVALAPISGSTTASAATLNLTSKKRYTAVYLKWCSSGSRTYQVQSATSSDFSKKRSTKTVTGCSTIFNRLSPKYTYYFRVRLKGTTTWSNKVHQKPARPSTFQGNAVQKASTINTDEVSGSSIDLSWATPSGQFACFRIQVSPTPSGGQPPVQCTTVYTLSGLKKATTYTIKMYTVAPAETVSGVKWPDIDITGASKSIKRTTSNYALSAPSDFTMTEQHADRITFSWTAPGSPSPAATDKYRVQFADNESMKKSPFYAGTISASQTSITVTGLSSNHNYYARVMVVDANGKQKSDKSSYILAKTLIRRGTISGTITGAPPAHVVAVAYLGGELVAQSDLDSNGRYTLSLRPGSGYTVRATYIGGGTYYSSWVSSATSPAVVSSSATRFSVSYEKDTKAGTTALDTGATISGKVINQVTRATVSGATVTLLTGSTGSHEVLGSVYSSGSFTIKGVPNGYYRLRVKYIGSSTYPAARTVGIHVTGSDITQQVELVPR